MHGQKSVPCMLLAGALVPCTTNSLLPNPDCLWEDIRYWEDNSLSHFYKCIPLSICEVCGLVFLQLSATDPKSKGAISNFPSDRCHHETWRKNADFKFYHTGAGEVRNAHAHVTGQRLCRDWAFLCMTNCVPEVSN